MGEYEICCIKCHSTQNLEMYAHRDENLKLVGWVFVCSECKPEFNTKAFYLKLEIRPLEKVLEDKDG